MLDFSIGAFRLVRSAEVGLGDFKMKTPVVFSGQPALRVEMEVVGPPKGMSRGLPMTIRRGRDVVRREMLPIRRGRRVLEIDISELKLAPGKYTLVAFERDPKRRKSAAFRVVESPWKEK